MIKINGKVIVNNHIYASSVWQKTVGLMFSKRLEDKALIFEFGKDVQHSFHMFFVFYPIDIIFLDKYFIVVDKKSNFVPFSCHKPKQKFRYAIELPNNKAREIKINDKVLIQ